MIVVKVDKKINVLNTHTSEPNILKNIKTFKKND